jgi:hypothetical protein
MRKRLPFLIVSAALVTHILVAPAAVTAQTVAPGPVLEVGPMVSEFVAVGGADGAPLIGARTSARLTSTVSAEFDLRFAASSFTEGLYGVRLRFMPRAAASSWYLFGGAGGFFQLPRTFSYAIGDGARVQTYRRPGAARAPRLLNGGAGWRFAGRRSWSASVEGDVWTSWDGGGAVGAAFVVGYGRRTSDAR